jgi:hypothetical protein
VGTILIPWRSSVDDGYLPCAHPVESPRRDEARGLEDHDNGRCHSISVDPAHLYGDTPDELAGELERFKAALAKPVLQYDEFDKASAGEKGA